MAIRSITEMARPVTAAGRSAFEPRRQPLRTAPISQRNDAPHLGHLVLSTSPPVPVTGMDGCAIVVVDCPHRGLCST